MTAEVTVLGAGMVGICSALSLAERGVRVRLIDRGDPGQETSFGNAGVISPWSIIPQAMPGTLRAMPGLMLGPNRALSVRWRTWPRMVPWGLRFLRAGHEAQVRATADVMAHLCGPSIELFRRHLAGTGHEGLVVDSCYVHAFRDASRATLSSLDYQIRQEKGADLELVGADRLRDLEPALSPDFKAAVLIKRQARALNPGRIGAVLAEKAQSLGVEFLRAEITRLRRDGEGWRIDTSAGPQNSRRVVMAMGAWSAGLLRGLGLHLPLMAERGYHVEFPDPGISLTNSILDVDAKAVLSSMEGGLRLAGQAEFGPVDAPPDPRKQALLTRIARAALPGLADTSPRFWMGRRPSFPDSLPALGEMPGQPGLFCNFGHAHFGLMMAPKSGAVLADLMTGTTPNTDLSALSPGRF